MGSRKGHAVAKKPTPEAIRVVVPLTALAGVDPMAGCNLCTLPANAGLRVWREHDERDQPIDGVAALVYIGADHRYCIARLEAHPRLYSEEIGLPGSFPRLCGDCKFRRGLTCSHPSLKANGGPGLRVMQEEIAIIICSRSGCHTPLRPAVQCVGKEIMAWDPDKDTP